MSTIYRVENPVSMQGLWYRGDGSYNPHVMTLSDGKVKMLPMDFNPAYKADGLDWFSGCRTLTDLRDWFSLTDLYELHAQGYGLYAFKTEQFRLLDGHAVFARQHVIESRELSLSEINPTWEATNADR